MMKKRQKASYDCHGYDPIINDVEVGLRSEGFMYSTLVKG